MKDKHDPVVIEEKLSKQVCYIYWRINWCRWIIEYICYLFFIQFFLTISVVRYFAQYNHAIPRRNPARSMYSVSYLCFSYFYYTYIHIMISPIRLLSTTNFWPKWNKTCSVYNKAILKTYRVLLTTFPTWRHWPRHRRFRAISPMHRLWTGLQIKIDVFSVYY